jgi:hypothetical protein
MLIVEGIIRRMHTGMIYTLPNSWSHPSPWYSMIISMHTSVNFHNLNLFSDCSTGTYGVNCEARCDTCVNRICDRFDGKCTYGCNGGNNGDRCNLTGITLLVQGADLSYVCAHLDSLYGYFRILIYNTQISTG